MCVADCAEKLLGHKPKNFELSKRQIQKRGFCGACGWEQCMVVADLFAVADLLCVNRFRLRRFAQLGCDGDIRRNTALHIIGEVTGVGAGISTELLFIERL